MRHFLKRLSSIGLMTLFIFSFIPMYFAFSETNTNGGGDGVSQYVPGEVLVKFKEGADPQAVLQKINLKVRQIKKIHSIKPAVAKFRRKYNLIQSSQSDEEVFKEADKDMKPIRRGLYRKHKLTLPKEERVEDVVRRLRNDPQVESAYPNYIRKVSAIPNDPRYASQWALGKVSASAAWDTTRGSPDVIVAIIDTGIDYNHEDLADNIWINSDEIPDNGIDDERNGYVDDVRGYDFVSAASSAVTQGEDPGPRDNNPVDFHGHGTHVAGIVAAVANNGIGIAGVAPNCKIMAVRAGYKMPNGNGYLEDADIEQAILYAVDNGARVINMSFGGDVPGAIEDELKTAYAEGVVLVAAAGNDNSSTKGYPAAMKEVIAVAATDQWDNKASFSTYGDWIDVAAPGVSILSTLPNNQYASWNGTSMACPYVAGIAALILSSHPEFTNEEVRQVIRSSADDIIDTGFDVYSGYGRVNAYKALQINSVCIANVSDPILDEGTNLLKVYGTASGENFQAYSLQLVNQNTQEIIFSQTRYEPISNGLLDEISLEGMPDGQYLITLKVQDRNATTFSGYRILTIDNLVITDPREYSMVSRNSIIQIKGKAKYNYTITWGQTEAPASWSSDGVTIGGGADILGSIDGSVFPAKNGMITIKVQDNLGNIETVPVSVGYVKPGWPKRVEGKGIGISAFAWFNVEDLDGDGIKEIIVLTQGGVLSVFRPDGSVIDQLVIPANSPNFTRPVIVDLDDDGNKEIVAFTGEYPNSITSEIYVCSLVSGKLKIDWNVPGVEIGAVSGGCIVGDLNHDGKKGIIISGIGKDIVSNKYSWYTTVYDYLGQRVAGWPKKVVLEERDSYSTGRSSGTIYPLSCVGNLDEDAELEIVSVGVDMTDSSESNNTASLYATCFKKDGQIMSGWPKLINEVSGNLSSRVCFSSPVIGDINGDGKNEIIIGTINGLYVSDRFGNVLWSKRDAVGEKNLISEILLSDIDNDRIPEIICSVAPNASGSKQTTYVYKGDGTLLSSHPNSSNDFCGNVMGDIDKNGDLEVITLRRDSIDPPPGHPYTDSVPSVKVEFWNPRTGLDLCSFDFPRNSPFSPPLICDLEGDGKTELVGTYVDGNSGEFYLCVWELDNFNSGPLFSDWPMFRHDSQLTGCYEPIKYLPIITNISPASASVGTNIAIMGSKFGAVQNNSFVEFYNGIKATVKSWSDTQIQCTLPQGAKTGEVFVVTGEGRSNGLNFTVVNSAPKAVSVSPCAGVFRAGQIYTFSSVYSDADGYSDLNEVYLMFGSSSLRKMFSARYVRATNKLYLFNGAAYIGGYMAGSNNVIVTPLGKLYCKATNVSGKGSALTLKWTVSFSPLMCGTKNIYLKAVDGCSSSSNWQYRGKIIIGPKYL